MLDVGLHAKGTEFRSKPKQTANATMRLASLTPEIFNHLKTEVLRVCMYYQFIKLKYQILNMEEIWPGLFSAQFQIGLLNVFV